MAAAPQEDVAAGAPPLRVLIVDDDPDIRDVLCAYLAQRGHYGRGAATMQEALAALATVSIDVLVTDVLLPDGDGLDLLNHILDRRMPIRTVVVTGGGRYFGPEYYRRIGEALGAIVLQKPFDQATFVSAVEGTRSAAAKA